MNESLPSFIPQFQKVKEITSQLHLHSIVFAPSGKFPFNMQNSPAVVKLFDNSRRLLLSEEHYDAHRWKPKNPSRGEAELFFCDGPEFAQALHCYVSPFSPGNFPFFLIDIKRDGCELVSDMISMIKNWIPATRNSFHSSGDFKISPFLSQPIITEYRERINRRVVAIHDIQLLCLYLVLLAVLIRIIFFFFSCHS